MAALGAFDIMNQEPLPLHPSVLGFTVSIVVINFNYGAFLSQAIESALAQSYPHKDIVVVDDGSTDNSVEVLNAYRERVRIIEKPHGGHVSAVNAGLAGNEGDLVVLLDADDLLYADCLSRAVAAWQDGAAKLQFRLDTIDGCGANQNMPFPAYARDLDAAEIRRRSLLTGYYPWPVSSGNMFSRDYLRQVTPIDETRIFKSPDGYLNKMAPLFGPVLTLDAILGAYRVHGRNAWAQSSGVARSAAYVRGTRFDAVLHAAFMEAARGQGHGVPPFDRAAVPQWVEVRFLSLRLERGAHPFAADTIPRVWWIGIRAARDAAGATWLGRVMWMGWFSLLALLPRSLIAFLAANWRAQSRRPKLARRLVMLSRYLGGKRS
jgi:glycosyltransferase involved in cell wall biosynthesis